MTRHILKTIVAGDGGIGKTSIVRSFLGQTFSKDYKLTIGIDISTKTVLINDASITFSIHDFAGQHRFADLKDVFMRGTQVALFVFDLTRKDSLVNLRNQWVKPLAKQCPNVLCLLIANKSDLVDFRVFDEETINKSFKELQKDFPECSFITYVETSARDHKNINHSFSMLGQSFLNQQYNAITPVQNYMI